MLNFKFSIKIPLSPDTLPVEVAKYHADKFSLLAAWRRYRGFSQPEVAKLAGVNRNTYANNERGWHKPSIQNLHKIADALGAKVSQISE